MGERPIKQIIMPLLILTMMLAGCASRQAAPPSAAKPVVEGDEIPVDLNVFAAASLSAAFEEIGHLFEAEHPAVTIVFNFAGSQQLAQQINEGAPADVFASANETQMNTVIAVGGITRGAQLTFARNQLVGIYPQDNPAGLSELKDLADPDLKIVLASREVPVGEYSLEFLDKAALDPAFSATFKEDVLGNVVSYEDNVKAVLAKVALGEADAGIVYASDISAQDAGKVSRLDIPDALNVLASYPIAPLIGSKHPELAQAFVELVLSQTGQDILARYNFISIK